MTVTGSAAKRRESLRPRATRTGASVGISRLRGRHPDRTRAPRSARGSTPAGSGRGEPPAALGRVLRAPRPHRLRAELQQETPRERRANHVGESKPSATPHGNQRQLSTPLRTDNEVSTSRNVVSNPHASTSCNLAVAPARRVGTSTRSSTRALRAESEALAKRGLGLLPGPAGATSPK